MEMITLHDLSVILDVSVRVLRHRLRQLLLAGKLIDGQDYRRDDYVDETHFIWKLNPASFIRETGYQVVTKAASKPGIPVAQVGSQQMPPATPVAPISEPTLPKVDTKEPGMVREMIDLLKGQIGMKDTQISDLTGANKTLTALNEKLTGVVVHQSDEIRSLLRLTGGKTELSEFVTSPVNESAAMDTKVGTNGEHVPANVAAESSEFHSR